MRNDTILSILSILSRFFPIFIILPSILFTGCASVASGPTTEQEIREWATKIDTTDGVNEEEAQALIYASALDQDLSLAWGGMNVVEETDKRWVLQEAACIGGKTVPNGKRAAVDRKTGVVTWEIQ